MQVESQRRKGPFILSPFCCGKFLAAYTKDNWNEESGNLLHVFFFSFMFVWEFDFVLPPRRDWLTVTWIWLSFVSSSHLTIYSLNLQDPLPVPPHPAPLFPTTSWYLCFCFSLPSLLNSSLSTLYLSFLFSHPYLFSPLLFSFQIGFLPLPLLFPICPVYAARFWSFSKKKRRWPRLILPGLHFRAPRLSVLACHVVLVQPSPWPQWRHYIVVYCLELFLSDNPSVFFILYRDAKVAAVHPRCPFEMIGMSTREFVAVDGMF